MYMSSFVYNVVCVYVFVDVVDYINVLYSYRLLRTPFHMHIHIHVHTHTHMCMHRPIHTHCLSVYEYASA